MATFVMRTRINVTFIRTLHSLRDCNWTFRKRYLKMQVHLSQQILFDSSKRKTTFWPFLVPAVDSESFGYASVLRRVWTGIAVAPSASIYCEWHLPFSGSPFSFSSFSPPSLPFCLVFFSSHFFLLHYLPSSPLIKRPLPWAPITFASVTAPLRPKFIKDSNVCCE